MHLLCRAWVVLLLTLLITPATRAVPVVPGDMVFLLGTTLADDPRLTGPVIHDKLIPIAVRNRNGVLIGQAKLQDRVVRSTATGTLIFMHRLLDFVPAAGHEALKPKMLILDGLGGRPLDFNYRRDDVGNLRIHAAALSERWLILHLAGSSGTFTSTRFASALTTATRYATDGKGQLAWRDYSTPAGEHYTLWLSGLARPVY